MGERPELDQAVQCPASHDLLTPDRVSGTWITIAGCPGCDRLWVGVKPVDDEKTLWRIMPHRQFLRRPERVL